MAGRRIVNRSGKTPQLNAQVDGKTLETFLHSRAKVDIIQGPVGSGKTRAALMRLGIMAAEQYVVEGYRESRWLITRATAPELKTLLKDFLELYPEEDGWGLLNQTPPMTFKMSVGNIRAEFVFLALDDIADVRKLKSTQFTGAYINEGQFVTLEMFTEIKERIDRYPSRKRVNGQLVGGARNPCVIMDMNAADESHWVPIMRGDVPMPDWFTVDQQRQHAKPSDWNFLVQPPALVEIKDSAGVVVDWVLNPDADNLAFLSPDYYPDKIAGRSKEVIDMTCMNRTGALRGGKPVHTGWNKEIHVAKEHLAYKPEHELVVGLDFGRTPAAVWGQQYGRRWYILGEYYLEDVSSSEFAPALKRELARRIPNLDWKHIKFWGDPAGDFGNDATNSTSYDIFRQHGLFVREAMAGLRITARLETVDAILARMVGGFPGILVDSSCRMLISGFGGGYKWKQVSGRDGMVTIDQPVKNKSSHPMDALQYLLAGAGEVSEVTLGGRAQKPVDTRVQARVFRRDRPGAYRRSA